MDTTRSEADDKVPRPASFDIVARAEWFDKVPRAASFDKPSRTNPFDKAPRAPSFDKSSRTSSFASTTSTAVDIEAASPSPKPKRHRYLRHFNLAIPVHLLSLTLTSTLLAVYIRDLTFNPSPTQINLLLIAAKAHELLIQASLATILLHRIRVCLRGSQGVPLGFLSAPFALNSVYYLFSKQFWKAATRSKSKERGDVTTRVLVVGIIFLALAAGPSAGILMLPKLGWWEVDLGVGEGGGLVLVRPPGVGENETVAMGGFYPREVGFGDEGGAGAAAAQILGKVKGIKALEVPGRWNFNLTVNGAQHQRDISVGWGGEKEGVVYATSPMDMVARELQMLGDRVWPDPLRGIRIVLEAMEFTVRKAQVATVDDQPVYRDAVFGTEMQWQQPAVAVQCVPCRVGETEYLVEEELQAPFEGMASPFSLPKGDFISGPSSFLVLDKPNPNLSTAFLWTSPDDKTPSTLCLVLAKWTKASVSISKPNDRTATTDWSTDPSKVFLSKPENPYDRVALSASFSLASLNAMPPTNNNTNTTTTTPTTPPSLPTLCPPGPGRCLPLTLSLLLTDSLSRTLNPSPLLTCRTGLSPLATNPLPLTTALDCGGTTIYHDLLLRYVAFTPTYFAWQYAYRIHSLAEGTAWILLALHALLVLVHFSEHGVRKKTYAMRGSGAGGWDEVGELVAVALGSERPGVRGVGEGEGWRLRVWLEEEKREQGVGGGVGEGTRGFVVRRPGEGVPEGCGVKKYGGRRKGDLEEGRGGEEEAERGGELDDGKEKDARK